MASPIQILSLSASTIGVFIISALTSGKTRLTLAHIQLATLAGEVVTSTPPGPPVHPIGALLIGFIAGIVSTLGIKTLRNISRGAEKNAEVLKKIY